MIFSIPITAIFGGFVYLIVRTLARSRVRELEIRERIAMIERGLVPAPETDPRGFERAMARHDIVVRRRTPSRFRGAGIIIIGAGMAFMMLIAFAGGEPGAAIGVGGAIVVLGLAFLLNSLFTGADELPPLGRYPSPPPPPIQPASPAPAQAEQRLD
jgi:hypothetical protein